MIILFKIYTLLFATFECLQAVLFTGFPEKNIKDTIGLTVYNRSIVSTVYNRRIVPTVYNRNIGPRSVIEVCLHGL